jgi:hypothetical protein
MLSLSMHTKLQAPTQWAKIFIPIFLDKTIQMSIALNEIKP